MGSNCEEINGEENDPCLSAMLLSFGPMVYTAVLNAAIELNLFEIIAKATTTTTAPFGVSASEIASRLPIQHKKLAQRLDRMLSVLGSHSLLTCSTLTNQDGKVQRLFQLSASGKYFINAEATASLALFTTFMNHPKLVQAFLNFKEILLDCDKGLYMKVHGMPIFEGIQSDPTWNHIFNEAMANICRIEMTKILEIYSGFEGISLLIDVGGGVGQSLNIIISKYPSIKGVNFDLPQGILHNWSDENCLKVLNNCYKALPENGKVVVVDFIMPEAIGSSEADKMVTSFDNLMFLDGGSERTEKEFMNLCQISEFSSFRVVSRAFTALGVMEFYK
ncbi:Isoliquiritigenin 2'-O-methyltransferase [Vigna angularis]|uniref:Isoliquiritigenin 2'-O-methyltransferase n=1 Tax=Phaseolus angularis TaxID=3914 RepID=A0A8T0JKY7_PHAAN|nr:Isoliquiritigenin 2'-O-methyltransferase [Vigna angularis]